MLWPLALIDPVIVHIGPFALRWYSLLMASSILLAVWLANRETIRRGLDPDFFANTATIAVPAGIVGARLYEVFVLSWDYYSQHPGEILAVWQGGLAIHGAILGGALAGGVYIVYKKQDFWTWADIIMPPILAAQALGRWGNFFNQEAHGGPAPAWVVNLMPGWFRDQMTIGGTVMHPTFFYESVWNLAAFGFLVWLGRKDPPRGVLFFSYWLLYNFARFFIESLRTDSSFILGGLRTAQVVSALIFLIAAAGIAYRLRAARQ